MAYQPSTTAIARTFVIAGILLAVLFLASQSFFPAFAQEGPRMVNEGVKQVATFAATDEDGDDITWSILTSTDADDFEISQSGVLTFTNTPDYEAPTDSDTENTYTVTIVASDGETPPETDMETVTVMVVNLDEPGVIELSSLQPQEGIDFSVTSLEDPDGNPGRTTATPDATDLALVAYDDTTDWQWARCSTTEVSTCVDIEDNSTSTIYTAVEADSGHYLRVTATYADGHTTAPEAGQTIELLDKTATAMSANPVLRANYRPVPPLFLGQDPGDIDSTGNFRETNATTSRDVAENSLARTNVGAPVTATDEGADGNQEVLTYTMSGTDATSYRINSGTGQISVAPGVTLDHETDEPNTDTVTIRATDPTGKYSEVDVTINIIDVDENPTVSSGFDTHDPFAENSHEASPTLTVGSAFTASDPEDEDTSLEWSVSGRDGARFVIPAGQLTFKEAPDFESPRDSGRDNTYDVTVVATDSSGNMGTKDVTVVVRNVQETGTITLSNLGARVGTSLTATLNEPDGVSGSVTWTWAGATTIVRTGGTSNSYTPPAGFADNGLTITATYTDRQAAGQTASANAGTVQANTTPAATPSWQTGGDTIVRSVTVDDLTEATTVGTTVSYDATVNDNTDTIFTYSLSGGDSSAFTIARDTGAVTTRSLFDRERKPSYNFTISVKNRANRSASLSVRVNVQDVNEPPIFTSGATTTDFAEDSNSLRVGGNRNTYAATDPERATVTLTLGGTDAEDFNFQNGILSFKVAPNYEAAIDADTGNDYVVTITASDGTAANNVEQTVNINVTDVDEPGAVGLDARAPRRNVQLQATLTDPDVTATTPIANQQWTWSNSDSLNGPWATSTGTGATTTAGANVALYTPNNDDVGNYLRAFVIYTDGESTSRGGTPLATKTAEIVSTNVVRDADYLNTAPIFPGQEPEGDDTPNVSRTINATTSREIAENSPAGTNVGAPVEAEDLDENRQQQVLTYTMGASSISGAETTDPDLFSIGRASGQITVKANDTLDREDTGNADDEYVVLVTATDPSGLTSSVDVTIEVTNIDEPPVIAMESTTPLTNLAATSTAETTASTTPLSTYSATDDEDDLVDTIALKWTLEGTDKDLFKLCTSAADNTTCSAVVEAAATQLAFKNAVSFEDPTDSGRNNVYDIIVTVTDSDTMTDTRPVAVTVADADEPATVNLSNRQPEVGVRIAASLDNPDGNTRNVTWKWEQCGTPTCGGTPGLITGATSATYVPTEQNLVVGSPQYLRATVTFTDSAMGVDDPDGTQTTVDESKSDTASMISASAVQAKPTTNTTPQFADQDPNVGGKQTTRYIQENSDPGKRVVIDDDGTTEDTTNDPSNDNVDAADGDSGGATGDVLTYTLGGRDASSFDIDWGTGQITVKEGTELNYETKTSYTVVVTATDSSLASDSITVTINVVDVNEAPEIMERGVSVSGPADVSYDEDDTATVASYSATGPDAAGATLSLSGTDASDFTFSGGVLSFSSPPDFENPADADTDNTYDVTVTATMGAFSDSIDVTVTVTNVDEEGTVALTYDQNQVRVGVAITAEEPVDPDGGVTGVTWQWESSSDGSTNWSDIPGATSAAYTPVDGDVGNFLRATASYTDNHGSGKTAPSEATPTAVVAEAVPGTAGTISVSPSGAVISGGTITATLTDADNPVSIAWQWQRSSDGASDWSNIPGAASASYTTVDADAGNYLRATATYTDDSGAGQTATSAATNSRIAIDSYDRNADGRIDGPEVLAAVSDYFRGSLTGTRVLAVVALYFRGL